MTLQVINDDLQGWTVLHVLGEVDYAVGPELREHVRRAVAEGRHRIILDLTGVHFCDSTGIGTLVAARRLLRSTGGTLRLVMPSNNEHHVNRVFTALGLRRLFDVHPDLSEALTGGEQDEDLVAAG